MVVEADVRKIRVGVTSDGVWGDSETYWSTTNQVLPASGWAHVVFTFSSGSNAIKLYVNSVEIVAWTKSWRATTSIFAGTANLVLAGRYDHAYTWGGNICNASVWDTGVLTQADITTLYGSGSGLDPKGLSPSGAANLVSSWMWDLTLPLVPGANDIPDRVAGVNDGTTQNMAAEDVVDSPWPAPISDALWVPDGYIVIPNSVLYPGEYIREGEDDPTDGSDSTTKGLVDLACNSNYLHKRVTKTYIYQDLTSAADEGYVEFVENAPTLPGILVGTWYVPALLDGQGLDVTVRARTTTAADTTLKVQIHDADRSSLIFDSSVIASTSWTDIVLSFTPAEIQAFKDTFGVDAPYFVDLYTEYVDFGTVAQIKGITASSTDDGENELTSGVRGDAHIPQCWKRWNQQSPLPVSRMEELQKNIESFRAEKVSTFAAYSDLPSDSGNAVYSSPESSTEWQTVAVIPVPYMPGVTSLGFALTGFYAVADDRIRVIAASGLVDEDTPSEITFTDPVGTWDTTDETQWQTGTVAVKEAFSAMGFASVYVQMKSPTTRGQALMGLTLWEVY